jgi:hypothetical protein
MPVGIARYQAGRPERAMPPVRIGADRAIE